jgi:hypothetical protein
MTHRFGLALFYWAFLLSFAIKQHVAADRSQPVPGPSSRGIESLCGGAVRAVVERAARQHEQAVVAEKDAFITELKELIEKLESQVQDYRRTKFGPKSEKLDPTQMELALEDLETAIAETQAQIAFVEEKIAASAVDPEKAVPRKERRARALPRACRGSSG